jgi:hypothetical protein
VADGLGDPPKEEVEVVVGDVSTVALAATSPFVVVDIEDVAGSIETFAAPMG